MPKGLSYGNEIWYGNTCERVACFYPPSQGVVPSILKFFGNSYINARTLWNNNQILHIDQTRCGNLLHGQSFTRSKEDNANANEC